jgi:hypothetical protein
MILKAFCNVPNLLRPSYHMVQFQSHVAATLMGRTSYDNSDPILKLLKKLSY